MDSLPFAAIFENLTDAVIILDEKEHVIYGNNEFYQITQRNKSNPINCHISEITDVNKLPKCIIFETYIIKKDGSRLAVEVSVSAVPDWPNRKILIARKLENRKWRDTIHKIGYESSLDSIVVHDIDGNLVDCNKTCCKLLGYTPEELTSMHLRDIEANFNPGITLEVFKFLNAGDKASHGPWPGVHIRKDGTKFPVEVVISTDLSLGRPLIIANCRDASAKEREAQLSQARLQAEAANQAKSAFLSMISHEIRTPLNGILGMLQLVRDTPLNKVQTEYIEVAYRSAKLLLTIIGDILDLQRIESGKLKLEQIGFDLWSIVTESRDLFKPLAHKKSIALRLNEPIDMHTDTFCGSLSSSVSTIEGSPREISRDFKKMSLDCASSSSSNDGFESIPWVIGDPTRLQQILGNLLSNAIKFTPKHGDIDVNVFIMDYTEEEIELRIEVVDNGVGISQEAQTRLFQPFVQAEQSTTRKYGGSGLGLSICKHIVHMMNGEIGVESEPERGSNFWFRLRFKLYRDTNSQLVFQQMSARENEIPLVVDESSHKPTELTLVVQSTEDRLKENEERKIKKRISNLSLSTKNHHLHSTSYDAYKNEINDTPTPRVDQQGVKILLVEDNSLNQKVAKKMLNKLNISDDSIALAENGKQAVDFVTGGNNFDLVFMDLHMPVLDGIEATKQIRQWEMDHVNQLKSPRMPIIALTASNEVDEQQDLIGLDGLILKPLALDKLRSTLDKYLPQWKNKK
jgi:PAS domain S-box-containing protein